MADPIDDSISVNPGESDAGSERPATDPRQEAGQDASIQQRLERNPASTEAQLDNALDESMDASDPPSTTLPGTSTDEPPASSGYDPEAEAAKTGQD